MAQGRFPANRYAPLVAYTDDLDDEAHEALPADHAATDDGLAALPMLPSSLSSPSDAASAPQPYAPPHAAGITQVSPIRPATIRKAEDAATPGDKARELEEAAERRARRKVSIDGFDENDWPPLVHKTQEPTGLAANTNLQPFNHTKQLTLRPGHQAARSRTLVADAPIGAAMNRGASSAPTTAARNRPVPPPFVLPTTAPKYGPRGPGPTHSAQDARPRSTIFQNIPSRRPPSPTIGDVFAVKQEQVDTPMVFGSAAIAVPDAQVTPALETRSQQAFSNGDSDSAWAKARNIAMRISARTIEPSQQPPLPYRSHEPSPADHVQSGHAGTPVPASTAQHTRMDVDDDDDADLYVQEEPAAQPWPAPSEDDGSDEHDGASAAGSDSSELDTQLHHAFDERTVHVASNGDNALLDGMEQNGHLAHMLPSQYKAWDEYDGHKAIFTCDDLDGLDPDSMNPVAAVKKLVKQFQGAWPGSNPEISRAAQDPNSAGKVRKNTFLVKNISADQQDALEYRRHYVIGTAKITTFSFKLPVSPFMGTVPETTLEAAQVREAIVQRWAEETGVIAVFDKHVKYKTSSVALRRRFFKYLRVVPMVTKAQGEHIVEFNVYADAHYLSPSLHAELRAALKMILIVDNFAGNIALKDPDWKCTACPSRGHPRGLCKTHDVEGWHPPPQPQIPAAQTAAAARGGPPPRGTTRGGRGARGGRGGSRGRGF